MKKVLFFCLIVGSIFSNNGFGDSYYLWGGVEGQNLSVAGKTAWGNPFVDSTFVQDRSRDTGKFRIKEGWACCGGSAQAIEDGPSCAVNDHKEPCQDDHSVMVFIARKIYEHGGRFCLTQLAVASGSQFWIVNQQPNLPYMPCVVLCEPGWDGPTCGTDIGEGKTGLDIPCDTTDIAANIERVRQNKYTDNDALTVHWARMGTADEQSVFSRVFVKDVYEHVAYLGATGFSQHSVVAQPVLIGAVGDHPAISYITSGPANSGKVKTLCAQGFTRNDKCEISSKNCGSNVWCDGYSDSKFRTANHEKRKKVSGYCNVIFCKDGTKALDSNFNCVEYKGTTDGRCDVDENILYGRYVKCSEGTIFNAETCECDKAKSLSKEIMRYGPMGTNALVNDQCWTKESAEDFQNCVLGTTSE